MPGALTIPVRCLCWIALALPLAGCANFSLNPWRYREWAEDEKYSVTFHQRIAELERVARKAPRMGARAESTCRQLATLYREDKDPLIREEVVRTAEKFDHPLAAQIAQAAMQDEDRQVRMQACRSLRRIGETESLRLLAKAVESDADFDVRVEATRSLADFRDPLALKALGIALEDPDPALQLRAVASLKKASGRDYGNSIPAWREFLAGGEPPPPQGPSIGQRLKRLF